MSQPTQAESLRRQVDPVVKIRHATPAKSKPQPASGKASGCQIKRQILSTSISGFEQFVEPVGKPGA